MKIKPLRIHEFRWEQIALDKKIIASLHIDSIDHLTDKEKKGKSECECQSGDEHQCIEWHADKT